MVTVTKQLNPVAEELQQIADAHNGVLKPSDVLEFAKDETTALHAKFTWDDGEAAHQYRLWQARQVIRVTVELIPTVQKQHRVYVSLQDDRKAEGGGYRTLSSVMSNQQTRKSLLAEARNEMNSFKRKYQSLKELAPVFDAMDAILMEVA